MSKSNSLDFENNFDIAIIGMSGRFPGARNITQFWQNLVNGVESITRFSDEELITRGVSEEKLKDPDYVKAGTIIADADMFDAAFFGYNKRDAEIMDPQQRIFLEIAWEALESAGYNPESYDGPIGVFAGASGNDYRKHIAANQLSITSGMDAFELMLGNDADFLTTRVSYKLNLKGPSLNIQTACSTSLVAVHQACQSLLTYQCDMALAGGVCIRFPQGLGYIYIESMIASPDGHCRPFDAGAQGTIFGHGAGIVVLKRLSEALKDNDTILAVIKGTAINNDGSMKVGFTAPSVEGQAEVISTALALGDVSADTVSYIETHGTGTPLGDPIEIEALTQAYRTYTDRTGYCAIGSVKSNMGHLDVAAGITGLIKTISALQHKKIPPSLHFKNPNPNIDFANSPFYVNDSLQEWQSPGYPRRAGVSSFGIGGTNAHIVLQEAPSREYIKSSKSWHLLPLSAKSETALQSMTANLAAYLDTNPQQLLEDTAYTLQQGRKHFSHRSVTVCSSSEDGAQVLSLKESDRIFTAESQEQEGKQDIIFMFSGQGSQHVNMGFDLYREYPFFKEQVDLCAQILQPHLGFDLRDILYPPDDKFKEATRQITQTSIAQPALFTIEYALAKLWNYLGILPSALVGHSIGEYTAACIAGVFTLEDALKLVAARGTLMQSLPSGSMLAIPLSQDEVQPYLTKDISLAVLNSASMSVVSGETEQIDKLADVLLEKGIEGRILHTSHAFHSPMMEPILADFQKEVADTTRNAPQIPFVSNLTGTWITEDQAKDPAYWARHLRQTVQFFACAGELLHTYPKGALIEVGPGQTLNLLTKQHPSSTQDHSILASACRPVERKNDVQYFLTTLGQLWLKGCRIDWPKLYEGENRCRVPLPTYPFEKKRYWLEEVSLVHLTKTEEKVKQRQQKIESSVDLRNHKEPENQEKELGKIAGTGVVEITTRPAEEDFTATEIFLAAIWKEALGVDRVLPHDNFFELGGHSLLGMQVNERIRKETGIRLRLQNLILNTLRQIAEEYPFPIPNGEQVGKVPNADNTSEDLAAENLTKTTLKINELQHDNSKKKMRLLNLPIILQDRRLQPHFFGNSESPLFGVYHPPVARYSNNKAVLLCYPIGHEYMKTHFSFRRLARMLSDAGCHVLRFDYFGIGDSAGDSSDGDVDRWKADIHTAFRELQDISGEKRISMVGVRFGATLAALSSANDLNIRKLVLWDPLVSGQKYIEELRKINNKHPYNFFKITGRDENFEELVGYPFPKSLRKDIKKINLMLIPKFNSEKIVLITSENRNEYWELRNQFEEYGIYFEHHIVNDAPEWGKPANSDKNVLVNETLYKIRAVIVEDSK